MGSFKVYDVRQSLSTRMRCEDVSRGLGNWSRARTCEHDTRRSKGMRDFGDILPRMDSAGSSGDLC
jgi:hypothetical protein